MVISGREVAGRTPGAVSLVGGVGRRMAPTGPPPALRRAPPLVTREICPITLNNNNV